MTAPRQAPFSSFFTLLALMVLVFFSHIRARERMEVRYPPLSDLAVVEEKFGLQDVALIVSGFRGVAADLAWVHLLQYMGGAQLLDDSHSDRPFPFLKSLTQRVIRIDPYFKPAYIFGAGLLAWFRTINRPDEAVEILEEGIRHNPSYWPFHSYLISLSYKKSDQVEKMLEELRPMITHPDCPALLKAILANTFKLNGKYKEAISIWQNILETSDDPSYRNRAAQQISELVSYLKLRSTPPQ